MRVFNLGFWIGQRPSRLAYSLAAYRPDRIARAIDVIFIVAAGNLRPGSSRPPWPEKAENTTKMLAGFGTQDQQITAPWGSTPMVMLKVGGNGADRSSS